MVVKSMHSGSVTVWRGKLLIFSVPQFYSSVKGGILTVPSGIDVVMCHTDPPLRLTHLFSQLQVCWLLTAHKNYPQPKEAVSPKTRPASGAACIQ